jgi:hypothetical protein
MRPGVPAVVARAKHSHNDRCTPMSHWISKGSTFKLLGAGCADHAAQAARASGCPPLVHSNAMDESLLRQQIVARGDEDFELLVFQLVKAQHPDAVRLVPPDGGADTLVPESSEMSPEVFQAKHYPGAMRAAHWRECERSLDRAAEKHRPRRVTFVFARDFNQPQWETFQNRLVARKPEMQVRLMTLSDLVLELDKHPAVKRRFFGDDDKLDSIKRQLAQGGQPLDTGKDLVARAHELGAFADQQDPYFDQQVSAGGPTTVRPDWGENPPYITVEWQGEHSQVRVDAWVREGAEVEPPAFGFTQDEEGQRALEQARRELARGKDAELDGGVWTRFRPPAATREFVEEAATMEGVVRIGPGEPRPLELDIETTEGVDHYELDVYPVPPVRGGRMAFAGFAGAVFVQLELTLLEEPQLALNLTLSGRFDGPPRERAEAARMLYAFATHERVTVRCPGLIPDEGLTDRINAGRDEELAGKLAFARELWDAVALIEERTDTRFDFPEEGPSDYDLAAIGTAANVLRTGEGTATFGEAQGTVEAQDIARIADRLEGGKVRRPVRYTIFGRDVELGIGEYDVPPLTVVEVEPQGTTPNAPARVRLRPAGDDQTRFRLVDK